jgi:CxxC motif-containing protein (DUF1111 family)
MACGKWAAGAGMVSVLLGVWAATAGVGKPGAPAFGDPLAGLTAPQLAQFAAGKRIFLAERTVGEGLGPVFNDVSCVACHSVPAPGGGSERLETRFGRLIDGAFDPMVDLGGMLIQAQGIGAIGDCAIAGEVVPPGATIVTSRLTAPEFGLGLVDAVPDETLLRIAQLQSAATPATAGRPNLVFNRDTGTLTVGRFGWKAQNPSMHQFAGEASLNENGMTSPLFPLENCPQGDCSLLACDPAPQPNLDDEALGALTAFMRFLGPPPRGPVTRGGRAGEVTFAAIGCADCHVPAMRTGPNPIPALDGVFFFPYSDFLLHDMGALGDGITDGQATATEMRTAPLWGLRVRTLYLHDGRATTIREAILAHDGQGRPSRDAFAALSASRQALLLEFLGSL